MSAGGNGHPEVEVFSPPYLFAGARPMISSAPAGVGYGQTFSVQTPDAASITAVTWIRLPSVTHAFDQNQRINRLSFTRDSVTLSVTAPNNANVTPPGHYMLFILNGQGVPSVATIVQVGGDAAPPPNAPTLSSMSPSSAAAGSGAFTLAVNGTNFVAGSTVQWNGAARATTFVSGTQLTAAIGAADVAAAGSATVTVMNPSGGGTSNGLTFTISGGGGLQVWITQPTPGATVSGAAWATVWIDGTSGASNTVTATLDGRAAGSTTSSSAGPISFA